MLNTPMAEQLVKLYPDVPFHKVLGIEIVGFEKDKVEIRLPFRGELAGGGQALHGGVISSLIDLSGALAAWSNHNPERGMKGSTVSITVNYLSAALGETIVSSATTVKRGKELIFCNVIISEENSKKLVANGSVIYRIV